MTKTEAKQAATTMLHAMEYLEKTCGEGLDMRPWVSNDHPISVAHWMLTQGRIDAVHASKTARTVSEVLKPVSEGQVEGNPVEEISPPLEVV